MWGVRVGGVSQYREVLRIYVTKLKRTCRDQHCCSSGCLQDVRYRSLGDQGMRTQMLSDQAVRPLLSLKPHYRLLSVKIATLLELNGFWITHFTTVPGTLSGYCFNTSNGQSLQSPYQWPSKAETLLITSDLLCKDLPAGINFCSSACACALLFVMWGK